jgi:hypothetical protein
MLEADMEGLLKLLKRYRWRGGEHGTAAAPGGEDGDGGGGGARGWGDDGEGMGVRGDGLAALLGPNPFYNVTNQRLQQIAEELERKKKQCGGSRRGGTA